MTTTILVVQFVTLLLAGTAWACGVLPLRERIKKLEEETVESNKRISNLGRSDKKDYGRSMFGELK